MGGKGEYQIKSKVSHKLPPPKIDIMIFFLSSWCLKIIIHLNHQEILKRNLAWFGEKNSRDGGHEILFNNLKKMHRIRNKCSQFSVTLTRIPELVSL